MKTRIALLTLVGLNVLPAPAQPVPLPEAHAHNDYEHPRPLLDALDRGFCSVEADIWLVEGQLLVAHDLKDTKPGRTLESLYLNPLRERIQANGGRVFKDGPSLTLLVDVKSEATNTYRAVQRALEPFRTMLTKFGPNRIETNAVTVIISGNRAREWMAAESERFAAYDGRLADLEQNAPPNFIPLISDNWRLHFRWKGTGDDGPLPEDERDKLRFIVNQAHARGQRVRFWGMPDSPLVWRVLKDEGVDLINTDNLDGLAAFLRSPGE